MLDFLVELLLIPFELLFDGLINKAVAKRRKRKKADHNKINGIKIDTLVF